MLETYPIDWLDKYLEDKNFTNNVYLDACGKNNVDTPFDIKPHEFLSYAEYDLMNDYDHHLINSLSNTKRAIESQIDSLLYGFGLYGKLKRKSFPTKIDELNNIGIISPRILQKINKKRNLLEHEYVNPKLEDVEDALDIGTLFISYTDKYLLNALISCDLVYPKDYKNADNVLHAEVNLAFEENKIIFFKCILGR